MYLSGTKVIAILCITTAISSAAEVLTVVQQQNSTNKNNNNYNNNDKRTSYELKILNEFLNYYQLHRGIIIYTSSTPISKSTQEKWQDNDVEDKFVTLSFVRKLSESYYLQFINTLSPNSTEYLLRSLVPRLGIFIKYNGKDKGKQMILNFVSMKEKFNKSLTWLVLMEGIKDPLADIQRALGYLNIRIDADVTVAVYRENFILDLYDVYKICHQCGSPLEIIYKGNWTNEAGFTILQKFQYGIASRRNNFKMFPVKASTAVINKSPTLNMTDLEFFNNDKDFLDEDSMQRKTYQLLKLMEDLYNFTFETHFADTWGVKINGTWTGVIGHLYSNQSEVGLIPLRYLLSRLSVIDYSRNIHYENIHFLFRHPKSSSSRNIFFQPLADTVWWYTLGLIIVTILLLIIHMRVEYKIFKMLQKQSQLVGNDATNTKTIQQPMEENHFDFIVLCIMEIILMQGPAPASFRCNSTRLLVLSVSLFLILLMQFYSAFIVSSLLSEAPRTITNLPALYNSSLEIGMEDAPYNYDVFTNSEDPIVRNLYKYRMCNKQTNRPNAMTMEEGVKKIGEGKFAFHASTERAYSLLSTFLTESEMCDLQEINFHQFITFTTGIGMRKSTPYYEFTTLAIAKFQEAALKDYNDKKWKVRKIDCNALRNEVADVDLEHFSPALGFLFFAIIISLLTLICEIIYKHLEMKRNLNGKINKIKA